MSKKDKTYELIGYFIEMKNPENIIVEKKILVEPAGSGLEFMGVFNTARERKIWDASRLEDFYLINWTAIDVDNPKERLIKTMGFSTSFKPELL